MSVKGKEPQQTVVTMPSVAPTQIVVKNFNYSIKDQKILDNLNIVFEPGKLSVIVGPSGSGKTTLQNLIAGLEGAYPAEAVKTGEILFNGEQLPVEKIRKIVGFVFQDDVILETMTVQEAIDLSVKLRVKLDRKLGDNLVKRMISLSQLEKAKDVIIGSPMKKGISGGERKRTAIGMELVSNPSVLLLDEPTSGLDTYTAFRITALLKRLAHRYGRTVVATLHQPSSEIYHMIDNLYVLYEGRLVYGGPANQLVPYFTSAGYHFDPYSNPLDVLFMDILNRSREDEFAEDAGLKRAFSSQSLPLDNLADFYAQSDLFKGAFSDIVVDSSGMTKSMERYRAKSTIALWFLLKRELRNAYRNPMVIRVKLIQTIVISIFIVCFYLNTSKASPPQLYQNYVGLIFFLVINAFFSSFQNILPIFANEKSSFIREHSQGYFGVTSYFLAKVSVELPIVVLFPLISGTIVYWIIGFRNSFANFLVFILILQATSLAGFSLGLFCACIFPSLQQALAFSILILLPSLIVAGLYLNVATIPVWIAWIRYISVPRYSFSALVTNQFDGWDSPGAQQYITNMAGTTGFGLVWDIVIIFIIFGVMLFLSLLALIWITRRAERIKKKRLRSLLQSLKAKPQQKTTGQDQWNEHHVINHQSEMEMSGLSV